MKIIARILSFKGFGVPVLYFFFCFPSCGTRGRLKEVALHKLNGDDIIANVEFAAPKKSKVDHDWGYIMAFVVSKREFIGVGSYSILDENGIVCNEGTFDSQTVSFSSWHSDKSKFSYNIVPNFNLESPKKYHIKINLTSPIGQDSELIMYYLDK